MAISPIALSEGGASVRAKLNAAIGQANLVPEKADADDVAADVQNLQAQIDAKASAEALDAEVADRGAHVQNLQAQINMKASITQADAAAHRGEVAAMAPRGRIGEPGVLITADLDGAPGDVTLLGSEARTVGPAGSVVVVNGAGIVAPAACFAVEFGRRYALRLVLRRTVDTQDPANDAIRIALRWLKADKSGLETDILEDLKAIYAVDGWLEYSFIIARTDGDDVDAVAPAAAVYVRPFARCYGSGVNHFAVMDFRDMTDAVGWSPDVLDLRRELAGLRQAQDDVAGQLQTLADDVTAAVARAEQTAFAAVSIDADFSISVGGDAKVIRHTATLTAPRAATIISSGAIEGSRTRIVRTGAGAFALTVGPGALKSMATGTWADFTFDGSAWFLSGAGAL